MTLQTRGERSRSQEDHWVPLSDLMTGLMMIFLLVAIVFMLQVKRNEAKIIEAQNRVRDIATHYTDLRGQLYQELSAEFKYDLTKWHASIKPDLTVRFEEPSVQFDTGAAVVKESFKTILSSFFPRYIKILRSPKYADAIEEVRIEGHTSSLWKGLAPEPAYYENMRLSQDRARSVLTYVFGIPAIHDSDDLLRWILARVTANGLSSARRLFLPDGSENFADSQRVEIRVKTSAEDQLSKILGALSQ
jgi:outer membrane protein OmpA-like peptidoglycan-associated protein